MKQSVLKDIENDIKSLTDLILDLRDGRTRRGLSDFAPPVNQATVQNNNNNKSNRKPLSWLSEEDRETIRMTKECLPAYLIEKIMKKCDGIIMDAHLRDLRNEGIVPPEDDKK